MRIPLRGRPSESLQAAGLRLSPLLLWCREWEQPEPESDSGQEDEEEVSR